MIIDLIRTDFTSKSTIGSLSVDGVFCAYVLENPLQLNPALGPEHIAIPYGRYPVRIRWSDHFKRMVPQLDNVPGRTNIEFHPGNKDKDTHGCLLPGMRKETDAVYSSVMAFEALFGKIRSAQDRNEDVAIDITRTQADPAQSTTERAG